MWFRVPNQIYFNMNAVENIRQFPSRSTVIITNPALEQIGHVDLVRRNLPADTHVHVSVIPDAEPEVKVVMKGVETLNFYKADQIIALGGGSVIDAAKIMKLKYESPEADLEELAAPFLDLRKRVIQYPTEKAVRARLIAIPTTSGTGKRSHSLCRSDGQGAWAQSDLGRLLTESGCGDRRSPICYVHAQGPYRRYRHRLSYSCPGSCEFPPMLRPIPTPTPCRRFAWHSNTYPLLIEHPDDEEARCMMHNAACIAAMAFANASVGVSHALAHAFGARFGVAHGRANALMLPHVISYNASVPTKFLPSPYQKGYVAHKKYAAIADLLGLGGHSTQEKVKSLVAAIERLLDQLGFPRSIAEMGISKEDFERAIPDLTKLAFDDPSWRSNPRMPLMNELVDLFWNAYHGRGLGNVVEVSQKQNT